MFALMFVGAKLALPLLEALPNVSQIVPWLYRAGNSPWQCFMG